MMEVESLMDDIVTSDNDTSWGGVDEGSNKDPDANSTNVWEEESSQNRNDVSSMWNTL